MEKKKKLSKLTINKETVRSGLDTKDMNGIKGGYLFSIIKPCSQSLCFSSNCDLCFTDPTDQCCI